MLYADAVNPATPPRERAQVACAWERLEERKRILRMKPKPRDVDVSKANAAKRAHALLAMPEEPPLDWAANGNNGATAPPEEPPVGRYAKH
jgi:hypothetical protein